MYVQVHIIHFGCSPSRLTRPGAWSNAKMDVDGRDEGSARRRLVATTSALHDLWLSAITSERGVIH